MREPTTELESAPAAMPAKVNATTGPITPMLTSSVNCRVMERLASTRQIALKASSTFLIIEMTV